MLELVKKYMKNEPPLCCSEIILYSANEKYNLELDKKALNTMAAFGGGINVESTCGVISGACAVIGVMFTEGTSKTSPRMKELVKEYNERFEKELKERDCNLLKELYYNNEEKCKRIIFAGAKILEEIIEENRK